MGARARWIPCISARHSLPLAQSQRIGKPETQPRGRGGGGVGEERRWGGDGEERGWGGGYFLLHGKYPFLLPSLIDADAGVVGVK